MNSVYILLQTGKQKWHIMENKILPLSEADDSPAWCQGRSMSGKNAKTCIIFIFFFLIL